MGSPILEKERYDNENQHQVTLSQGFWIADTVSTQAFWKAVMGDNPAFFTENENNPVEQVSWDDVQNFIKKLNLLIPGLGAQLPTEAQWEYACVQERLRHSHLAKNISPELVNYDGNRPYAKGEKGQCREKTVAVKSLPANSWGLYEMHGNVWEWCADWYDDILRCRFPTRQVRKPALAAYCVVVRGVTMDGVRVPLTAAGMHQSIVTITSISACCWSSLILAV